MQPAFNTPSGFPAPTVNLKTGSTRFDASLSLSEPTSLQLEYRLLAKLLGKPELREGVDKVNRHSMLLAAFLSTAPSASQFQFLRPERTALAVLYCCTALAVLPRL